MPRNVNMDFDPPKPFKKISCAELLKETSKITHNGFLNLLNNYNKVLKHVKKFGKFPWFNKYAVIHHGCLYIFDNGEAKKSTVAISLYGYNKILREDEPKYVGNMTNAFRLEPVQHHEKTFYFAVPSEKERSEWMAKIKQAMLFANGRVCSMLSQISIDSISLGSVEQSVYDCAEDFQGPKKNTRPSPDLVSTHWSTASGGASGGGRGSQGGWSEGGGEEEEEGEDDDSYTHIDEEDLDAFDTIRRQHHPSEASDKVPLPDRPPPRTPADRPPLRSPPSPDDRPPLPPPSSIPNRRPPAPPKPSQAEVNERKKMFEGMGGGAAAPRKLPPGARSILPTGKAATFEPPSRGPPPVPTSQRPNSNPTSPKYGGAMAQPDYMEPRVSEPEALTWDESYWQDTERKGSGHAFTILRDIAKEGVYLVRDGTSPGEYTLCVFADNEPRKYKIQYNYDTQQYYIKKDVEFTDMLQLLSYYYENDIPNRPNCFLSTPYTYEYP